MMIIGIVSSIRSGMDVVYPTSYYYPTAIEKSKMTPQDAAQEEKNRKLEAQRQIVESKKNLVGNVALFLVALPVFVYHWRKIENEKQT
jgi:hypothetical protein